jgi:hypothetical protein
MLSLLLQHCPLPRAEWCCRAPSDVCASAVSHLLSCPAHRRLVSENTIEENILRKSDQKRQLDWLAIQSGGFNTDMLQKLSIKDLLAGAGGPGGAEAGDDAAIQAAMRNVEDEADVAAAAVAEKVGGVCWWGAGMVVGGW